MKMEPGFSMLNHFYDISGSRSGNALHNLAQSGAHFFLCSSVFFLLEEFYFLGEF